MNQLWLVLLPPITVLLFAVTTRQMVFSFLAGIAVASFIATNFNFFSAVTLAFTKLYDASGLSGLTSWQAFVSNWSLSIFIFLICLGVIISLLTHTKIDKQFSQFAKRYTTTKQRTEITSLLLSPLFFIDDYFSALSVGSIMRPLAQSAGLHPVKLAFLITSMASSWTIISPISSWIGEITMQMKQSGIDQAATAIVVADPYNVFVQSIPFLFYPFFLIFGAWIIVLRKFSFGPMKQFDQKQIIHPVNFKEPIPGSIIDFFVPITLLVVTIVMGILYTGNFWLFNGSNSFGRAIAIGSINKALLFGGTFSLATTIVWFAIRKIVTPQQIFNSISEGFYMMLPSIAMLASAWALGSLLKYELHAGTIIASYLTAVLSASWLPVFCFIVSICTSLMIGSSWATIGLVFPLAIPMVQTAQEVLSHNPYDNPLLFIVIAAILSGSIMGTHISFIADNPLMTSASTSASHLDHIKTMTWYILPIGISALVSFAIAGFIIAWTSLFTCWLISTAIGIIITYSSLQLGQWLLG